MSTNDQPETTADEALPIEVLDDEAVEVEVFDDEAVKVEALHDPEQGVPPVASGRRWRLSVVLPLALLALSAAAAASRNRKKCAPQEYEKTVKRLNVRLIL